MAAFGANCIKFPEAKPILSATKYVVQEVYRFLEYLIYGGRHALSLVAELIVIFIVLTSVSVLHVDINTQTITSYH